MDPSRVSFGLLLGLLGWVVVYYRSCTPKLSGDADPLALVPGDTVGVRPEALKESLERLAPGALRPGGEERDDGAEAEQSAEEKASEGQSEPAKPRVLEYVVRRGDTMQSIAREFYGSTAMWTRIAGENPLVDPKRIREGDTLRIPMQGDEAQIEGDSAGDESASPSGVRRYIVKPGDTLSEIAEVFYGDSTEWRRILDANRAILPRATALREGMELVIPPR